MGPWSQGEATSSYPAKEKTEIVVQKVIFHFTNTSEIHPNRPKIFLPIKSNTQQFICFGCFVILKTAQVWMDTNLLQNNWSPDNIVFQVHIIVVLLAWNIKNSLLRLITVLSVVYKVPLGHPLVVDNVMSRDATNWRHMSYDLTSSNVTSHAMMSLHVRWHHRWRHNHHHCCTTGVLGAPYILLLSPFKRMQVHQCTLTILTVLRAFAPNRKCENASDTQNWM